MTKPKPSRKPAVFLVGSLAAYLILTLAMTYPLVLHLSDAIPGDGFDGWQNYWNLWWMKRALIDLGQSPYFTDFLDYPAGVSLHFHTLNPFNGLWSLPIQLVGGLILAYNTVVFLSFALGGLGVYLLARYVLRGTSISPWPAWVAGLIFTFSPFHFAHLLGHMQVFSLEWLPFYVLFLLKAVEDARRRRLRALTSLLPALFLVLVGLCDWYYVMYLGLFTVLYLAYALLRRQLTWAGLLSVAVAGFAGLAALSPLWLPMALEAGRAGYMRPDPEHILRLSADLLAFVTPNEMHPLWGQTFKAWSERFTTTTSERMVFAGFAPLGLAAYALFRPRLRERWFWLLSLLFFGVLSLGPVLHVGGRTDLPLVGVVPLPYDRLNRLVPFMDISRSVSRFDVMVMLSLSILAAMGLSAACGQGGRGEASLAPPGRRPPDRTQSDDGVPHRRARLLGLLATVAIGFEFLPVPYPLSPPDTPAFYYTLAQDGADYAVLNLPMDWDRPQYLLYQTVHGKRLISAYTSRDNPRSLVDRTPVLQEFRRPGRAHVVSGDLTEVGLTVLQAFDIRYVVVDFYQMPDEGQRSQTLGLVQQIFGPQQPIYRDERLIVYEVKSGDGRSPFVRLGEGWSAEEDTSAGPQRRLSGEAEVVVYSPVGQTVVLQLALLSPGGGQVIVDGGGLPGKSYTLIRNAPTRLELPLSVSDGDNLVLLRFEGSGGLALRRVSLVEAKDQSPVR